jgi:hypothetical protein
MGAHRNGDRFGDPGIAEGGVMFIPSDNFPPRDVLISMLQVERYHLSPMQSIQFWLCVDDARCEIVKSPTKPFGIYKRGRIDVYYSNKQLEDVADDLLDGLAESYLAEQRLVQWKLR